MYKPYEEYRSRALYTNYYAFKDRSWFSSNNLTYDDAIKLRSREQPSDAIDPQIIARLTPRDGISIYGFNSRKSHPMQKKFALNEYKIFMHAEIHCLVQALRTRNISLVGSTIEVYRWTKVTHTPVLSFPCDGCFKALKESGVSLLKYFREDGNGMSLNFSECV